MSVFSLHFLRLFVAAFLWLRSHRECLRLPVEFGEEQAKPVGMFVVDGDRFLFDGHLVLALVCTKQKGRLRIRFVNTIGILCDALMTWKPSRGDKDVSPE